MLTNYTDINFIMELDYDTGLKLMIKLYEKKNERKAWELYLTLYPNMTEQNFISFDDYKNSLTTNKANKRDDRTDAEIIADAERIKLADTNRR